MKLIRDYLEKRELPKNKLLSYTTVIRTRKMSSERIFSIEDQDNAFASRLRAMTARKAITVSVWQPRCCCC